MLLTAITTAAAAATMTTAIVTTDQAVLRASPRESAPQQAQLWQGEVLEVRGERLDYLQVWDHRRERGGYVKAAQVKRTALTAAEAPELLAVLRFIREAPGAESLGIGVAAAYLQAAPAETLRGETGAEALDVLGTLADRLAQRASNGAATSKHAQAALSAHLEVAARYGVKFHSYEQEGRIRICYDGEAFRRVLAMPAQPLQKARAALALTQPDCMAPNLQPQQRHDVNLWRADVLDRVDTAALPGHVRNKIALRRAAVPAMAQAAPSTRPSIVTQPGQPGETCVLLVDAKRGTDNPLARRCTYALVWPQSASLNREGNALALAVQPMEAWRELWLFRKQAGQWTITVLPPATLQPELGYAEFAGWVPGGQQVLVAREARGEGRYRRNYEVVSLDSLVTQRQSGDPEALGPFQRWQDPAWKKMTVSLR